MILRVPIPREKHMLVSRFEGFLSAQFLDDGEDFLVVGYREGASCAEVIFTRRPLSKQRLLVR